MSQDRNDSNQSADDGQRTTQLPLPEMNCPWNSQRIAAYLRNLEGVVETSLTPRSETVVVEYNPARTSEAVITDAVRNPEPKVVNESTRHRSGSPSRGCRCRCSGRPR